MIPRNWLQNMPHRVHNVDASWLRPLLMFAEDPHSMAARLHQGHEAAIRRAADQHRLLEKRPTFLGMPTGTSVSVPSSRCTATIRAYDASVPGYILFCPQHGFSFMAASQVIPDLSKEENFESRICELERLHEAEVHRIAEVCEANELAASWHFHLPVGTVVEVDTQHVPPVQGLLHIGVILGVDTDVSLGDSTYMVAFRSSGNAASISNSSFSTVRQQYVRPSFWEAASPLQSARELQSRIGALQKEA